MGKKLIVIPARMGSNRLPGKPLIQIAGKRLLDWTYEAAKQVADSMVIVATPDQEIVRYCRSKEIPCRPTRKDHPTGTHRCAEILDQIKQDVDIDVVVNWQVDEPLVDPKVVNQLMESARLRDVCTLVASVWKRDVVWAAVEHNRAYWFSRARMVDSLGHCGIYIFVPSVLKTLGKLPTTELSRAESLEQLAWIQDGFEIRVVELRRLPPSVNTFSDVEVVAKILEKRDAD